MTFHFPTSGWLRHGVLALALVWTHGAVHAQTQASARLQTQFAAASAAPGGNLFDQPVYLHSAEESGSAHGEVFAQVDHPYAELRQALTQASQWCSILILHLNVQYCRPEQASLKVGIGRKTDQPLADLYWVTFAYRVVDAGDDHLDVVLQAPSGPLGTQQFRIQLEAAPATANGKSIIHMTYGYAYGVTARLAMQAYLGTIGRGKIGFSTSRDASGQPVPSGGMLGVLERNTVRYYLAIKTYLDNRTLPPEKQLQASLADWFAATEHYPQQLHELDRDEYLQAKQREIARQLTESPPKP